MIYSQSKTILTLRRECQITAAHMSHTWYSGPDVDAASATAANPPPHTTVTQTRRQTHQYFMCFGDWHRLVSVAGIAEAKVLYKRASIRAAAGCSEGSSYWGGRHTEKHPQHKSPSTQGSSRDVDTSVFSTQRLICSDNSHWIYLFQYLKSSCFNLTGTELQWMLG